jgi:hypothetical protein
MPELTGLPNTVAGFAQAVVKLRNTYAPNVLVGYHVSTWGTGTDILVAKPANSTVQTLATNCVVPIGGTWRADGTILFADNPGGPIRRTTAQGGEPTDVTRVKRLHSAGIIIRNSFLTAGNSCST